MICDVCVANIMYTIDQIQQEEFVTGIVDVLSGEGFCGMEEDPEMCAGVIAELIPAALPLLLHSNQRPRWISVIWLSLIPVWLELGKSNIYSFLKVFQKRL